MGEAEKEKEREQGDLPGGQRHCPEAVVVVAEVPEAEAAEVKVEEPRSLRTRRTV